MLYTKLTVLDAPFAFTEPLSVALVVVTDVAAFVVTDGAAMVLTVTDPDADELSPPPTTLAVFVSDAPASLATDAVTLTPA